MLSYSSFLSAGASLFGLATAKTKNIKGIAVLYRNEEESLAIFKAVGSPVVVNEILSSVASNILLPYDELLAEWRKNRNA